MFTAEKLSIVEKEFLEASDVIVKQTTKLHNYMSSTSYLEDHLDLLLKDLANALLKKHLIEELTQRICVHVEEISEVTISLEWSVLEQGNKL